MTLWSETLEATCQSYAERIANCMFVKQICDGSLMPCKFAQFIAQDSIYLNSFKGSLLFLSERLKSDKERYIFRKYIYSSTEIERETQRQLDEHFHWSDYTSATDTTTSQYIKFEREACCQQPIHNALASLLPCFWLFFKVVCKIKEIADLNNPFHIWIEAYSDPIFISDITTYRSICDQYAAQLSEKQRNQMSATFIKAAEYELKFWSRYDKI